MVGRQNQWPPRCNLEGWLQRSICCPYSKFNAQFILLNYTHTVSIGLKFMSDGYVYFIYRPSSSYILVAYQDAATCIWFWQTVTSFIWEAQVSQSMYVMLKMLLWCMQIEHLKKMCGTIMTPAKKLEPSIETVSHKNENLVLPKEFDARKKWDSCPTIGTILGWRSDICSLRMLLVFNTRSMHLSILQTLSFCI